MCIKTGFKDRNHGDLRTLITTVPGSGVPGSIESTDTAIPMAKTNEGLLNGRIIDKVRVSNRGGIRAIF